MACPGVARGRSPLLVLCGLLCGAWRLFCHVPSHSKVVLVLSLRTGEKEQGVGVKVVTIAAPGYVQTPPLYPYSPNESLVEVKPYEIVGFWKLRELLRPKHPYFKDNEGYLRDFSFHDDGDNFFCYPRVKIPYGAGRNPYRKRQLRAKHTARTIKKLLAFKDSWHMDNFKVAVTVLTFPGELSEWLSKQSGGTAMTWRLFKRFWAEDYSTLDDDSSDQAAYVNLHKWKTEEPVLPHFHFHVLVPNYRVVEVSEVQDEDGNNTYEFKRKSWHKQRGGREVPFSDGVLQELKKRWHSRLVKFATRHGIRAMVPASWEGIDVFVDYVSWDNDVGKARLMNKLNYQSRHWIEDYATFSNKHTDCVNPPSWLEGYSNATRTFGWWRHLTSLTIGAKEEKQTLSPINGKPMEYKSTISLDGLLMVSGGTVGTLEFFRGVPLLGQLCTGDFDWLRSVRWRDPWEVWSVPAVNDDG